jgi:hypothetical protein
MLNEAGKLGCKRTLALGLVLARTLVGAAIPEEVLRRIQFGSVVQGLVVAVCERLFQEVSASPAFLERAVTVEDVSFNSVGFHLRARERWRDRAPYCLYVLYFLLTPTRMEQTFVRLPPALSFLYYFLAPIQKAVKGLMHAVQGRRRQGGSPP